uniref:CHK domain-containing protein n=1 Tax=Steinernema glaseri TaxID=37863 RepID=A0A1I7ZH96_9BILA
MPPVAENFVPDTVHGFPTESPFNIEWLLDSLREKDDQFQKIARGRTIENINCVDVSQGKGYISTVYNASIKFVDVEEPYQVILKLPGAEALNGNAANTTGVEMVPKEAVAVAHNKECGFYNDYAPHLDIPLPKVYKAVEMSLEKPGALLMESLVGRGESCCLQTGSTKQQVMIIAKHLTTLYKYSLCLPEEKWRGKYAKNTLCSLVKEGIFEDQVKKLKAWKPGAFDKALDVFGKYACSESFYTYLMTDVYKDIGLPPVLTHGDLWSNNLLWKTNADGSLSNELLAIIDWQVFHEGCITNDMARYMAVCVDGDVRREHQYAVLRYMYERLACLLEEEGRHIDFTFEQMKQAYEANFVGHSLMVMIMIPFAFTDDGWTPEEAPIKLAQREKVLTRIQLAIEDSLEYFKNIPKDKL